MSVEAVQPRAEVVGAFWRLKLKTVTTIDIEVMIARLSFVAERIKN